VTVLDRRVGNGLWNFKAGFGTVSSL